MLDCCIEGILFEKSEFDQHKIFECGNAISSEIHEDDKVSCSETPFGVPISLFDNGIPEVELPELTDEHDNLNKDQKDEIPSTENANTFSTQLPDFDTLKQKPYKTTKRRKLTGIVHRRWGKKEDKALFAIIREMEKNQTFTLDELLQLDVTIDLSCHEGIQELQEKSGWKATPEKLITRIQTISKFEFSFREIKNLKRILRKDYDYRDINYEEVINEFPGKTIASLHQMVLKLKKSYLQKNLTSFGKNQRKSVKNI